MPLDIKNIDKEAGLPEGIEFRKELVWERIQTRKKTKLLWPWAVASAVILGLGLTFLTRQAIRPVEKTEVTRSSAMSVGDQPTPENSPLPAQAPQVTSANPSQHALQKTRGKVKPENPVEKPGEIPDFLSTAPQPVNALRIESIDLVVEPLAEEKSLSPAASRLQKSIQKMNPSRTSQQSFVVERFDLIQKIQNHSLQASSSSSTNSRLNSLFHGKSQKN